jgi:ribosomal protein S18 acetylase RimI-like enzyme
MPQAFDIRFLPARQEDFDYFYALRKETMMLHYTNAGKGWPEEEELTLHRQTFDVRYLRMIYLNEERIGFVAVRPEGDQIHIEQFCIVPGHQNQGIGMQVMQMILSEPASRERQISLNVLHQNPAAHLYERLMFECVRKDEKLSYYTLRRSRS